MIIIVYSAVTADNIEAKLGEAEYSYYYVLKEFVPILQQFGIVVTAQHPETEVDAIYHNALAHGQSCIFISFSPPHKTCLDLECPTIPALAWEFSTIPTEVWFDDPAQDWRYGLAKSGMAITHSHFAVQAIRKAMGEDYPVFCMPAPVWDSKVLAVNNLHRIASTESTLSQMSFHLSFAGSVFDTRTAVLQSSTHEQDIHYELPYLRNKYVAKLHPISLELSGVLYFSVFNPQDHRKNWLDMLDGFIMAHRDNGDATLVLKLVNKYVDIELRQMIRTLAALQPFVCRVVILQGYIEDADYTRLQNAMHYVVNTSHGEGQCLPLMELMSMGKPAIAPYHSSMIDYITPDNAFIIDSHLEPTFWSHDPRQAYRTMRSRINAQSVIDAFIHSYEVIKNQPTTYQAMAQSATDTMYRHCSMASITKTMTQLFASLPKVYPNQQLTSATIHPLIKQVLDHLPKSNPLTISPKILPALISYSPAIMRQMQDSPLYPEYIPPLDSKMCGLYDARLAGWYNAETGELIPELKIEADDVVLDIGCGDGASSIFAAERGATVVYADIIADKVQAVKEKIEAVSQRTTGMVTGAESIDLPDNYATKILAREVLEHVDDPKAVLQELVRIGKQGAAYLLTVPEADAENVQKKLGPASHFEKPNHIHIFNREEFADLVESVGLKIQSRQYYGFYWSMWMNLFCTTQPESSTDIPSDILASSKSTASTDMVLDQWAITWQYFLQKDRGPVYKGTLDEAFPKSQLIIATKI